jgi:hypothetical protein
VKKSSETLIYLKIKLVLGLAHPLQLLISFLAFIGRSVKPVKSLDLAGSKRQLPHVLFVML